jgi:transcriptional regulator with XRE-family HTH domain
MLVGMGNHRGSAIDLSDVLLRHDLTGEAFAEGAGVSMVTYRAYRRGYRVMSPEVAMRAAEKLGIPRHELRPDLWPPPQLEETKRRRNRAA